MGDCCLAVEFEARVDVEINDRARALANHLLDHPIAGVVDVVPTFTTVALYYRPDAIEDDGTNEPAYRRLGRAVQRILVGGVPSASSNARTVEVPVCYDAAFGFDLDAVASACALTTERVIELHAASPHVVFMLGFAPGFPYLGGLDPRLRVPRRATPRTRVPAGSVAIAREQSIVYSLDTPGGWSVLGRTPLRLFTPETTPPSLLRPGDHVRFVPISRARFDELSAEVTSASTKRNP
jgi:inhibitor of KinA